VDNATYQKLYQNATPQEREYLKAKQTYQQAHEHHETLRKKIRKTQKLVNSLTAELGNQSGKLQRMSEDLVRTIEWLKKAKAVYGPLRQAWKEANPRENPDRRLAHEM
jgi:predicted nuclease with TOPRIM domain